LPIFGPCPISSFCIPTTGKAVPAGPDWFHEIKFDGYRLRVERDGDRVRLITRGGYDWTKRFPWIAEAALKNRRSQFVIDGEAVILGGRRRLRLQRATRRQAERRGSALRVRPAGGRR
jgi:ATP-dependent DNA ligase